MKSKSELISKNKKNIYLAEIMQTDWIQILDE